MSNRLDRIIKNKLVKLLKEQISSVDDFYELLINTPIESLTTLIQVEHTLNLTNSKIKDLGDLEYVGKDLILKNTPITNLGKIEEVGRNLNIEKTSITNLDNLMEVGAKIFIKDSELAKRYTIDQLEEMYPRFIGQFVI